jgi:diguanylate cyclase (GGDEF)-like protein/PAS domain S-box-containing protein
MGVQAQAGPPSENECREEPLWSLDQEARRRSVFEQNGSIMLVVDPASGVIVDANRAAAAFYGYTQQQLIGMFIDRINALPAAEVAAERQCALREERTCFHFPHRLASGEIRNVEVFSSPVQLDGHTVLFSIVHDITERSRIEKRLRDSEEAFRSTFEQAAVGMVHVSFDGVFLRANTRFAEIVGYTVEELPGMSVLAITPPAQRPEALQILHQVSSDTRATVKWEKQYLRKDGSLTWARLSISVQRDSEGNPLHQIGFVEEIDEQKTAELDLAAAAQALQTSEQRYRTAFQTSLDAISISRLEDGKILEVNQTYLDIFGFERVEVVGRTAVEIHVWTDPEARQRFVTAMSENRSCRDLEFQFRRKSGEEFWAQVSATRMELDGVLSVLSVFRDVSSMKADAERMSAAAKALQASEDRYRTAFRTSLDAFTLSHLESGLYLDVNQAYLDMLGFERQEVIGHSSIELNMWKDPQDRFKLVEAMEKGLPCRDLEFQLRRKNGEIFWAVISASPMDVDGVPSLLAVIRDISATKAAAEEIRSLAFYDPLTHLPNRRLLLDRLQQSESVSIRNGHYNALLFVDLDSFKTVNDTLGHHIGDLLLIEVARRLVGCIRKSDTVGRLGGDEFVVILEDLGRSAEGAAGQARGVGEKILQVIEESYLLDGHPCRCTASIGVSIFGSSSQAAEEILRQADIAMYQAKSRSHSSLHFFAPALQAAVSTRAALVEDLRQAIAQEQFELFYQPQMDLRQIVSCEALVRWNHPTRGLLPPGDFIALAEETGQILALGTWVLSAACDQLSRWSGNADTARLGVSVNISALQFRQPGFVDLVLAELERSGANPLRLCLELTESTLLDSVDETIAKIAELKSRGVSFALDDFGTGYSSLSYLKRLPLDQLKIDRSFIRDILVDVSSGAIVQTIVALGRAIGLEVIAEGVETAEQRDYLARLGCNGFQGFLFSRPRPLEEFEGLLQQLGDPASR